MVITVPGAPLEGVPDGKDMLGVDGTVKLAEASIFPPAGMSAFIK
jgi:hypothetical protein